MKKIFPFIAIGLLLLPGCGKDAGNGKDLASKKAKLASLITQRSDLNTKISALEKEIAQLDTTQRVEKTKLVSVNPVAATTFNHYIDLQGAVAADQEIIVTPKMAGTVTKLLVNVGDKVKAGQLLAELDDVLLQQNLAALQTQLDFVTNLYNKQKSLWDQNIGTEVQYLSAKNQKESIEKQISTVKEQWDMTRVKAPISGTVDEVTMKIGMPTSPGNQFGAIRIINLSKLKVKAEVAEAYAGKIREGNDVILSMPDINREINSKIHYVGKTINTQNRTFVVEIPLRADEPNVIPNMVSLLKIVDYHKPNAIVVPVNLIQKSQEGDFVFIADESSGKRIAKHAHIKVGNIYKDEAEVLSGLKPGDQLIVSGYQDLNEGDVLKL